ncbi:VWA domain-containing protein [Planctomycetota bacterium]
MFRLSAVIKGIILTVLLAGLSGVSSLGAEEVKLHAGMASPVMLAGKKQNAYLKVSLTGQIRAGRQRSPVNIAIVLDKSGSMSGEKIEKAKEAAIVALRSLDANDIISVITYDSTVQVLVPATKVSDKEVLISAINRISAGGNTALFGGVSKGAQEVRKFLQKNRVNRIILISDGLANVGPSTPAELGGLGSSLIKEGISVTTIGLGLDYNEDLMTTLAVKSDGNHAFVEHAGDLARIFDYEFGDVLSVIAQAVEVRITCNEGIRPVRVLGREAEIDGREVVVILNQIYGEQEKYVLLEVEVPPVADGGSMEIASVDIYYAGMTSKKTKGGHRRGHLHQKVSATFSNSAESAAASMDKDVMLAVIESIANETNELALDLRDTGKTQEAQQCLNDNVLYLKTWEKLMNSPKLRILIEYNRQHSENLDPEKWKQTRKGMRNLQNWVKSQQSYNSQNDEDNDDNDDDKQQEGQAK